MNAFPTPPSKEPAYRFVNGVLEYDGSPSMSLRDYFASKAMQALNSGATCHDVKISLDYVAETAYQMADAMLKARES